MKSFVLGTIVVAVLMSGGTFALAENSLGVDISTDFYSKYIWRGQNLNDDYAFQPGLSVSYGGLTAGIWGSLDMTDYTGNEGQFTELDYSLGYAGTVPGIDKLGYSIGLIYYDFPSTTVADTTELYWGLNLDVPLSPSVTFYHDLDEADGTYISFGLSHSIEKLIELTPDIPVGMEIGASMGWGDNSYNKYYWSTSGSSLNDLAFSVSFPVKLGSWTLAPSVNYVTILDSSLRDSDAYATGSDYFFTGISLSTSF